MSTPAMAVRGGPPVWLYGLGCAFLQNSPEFLQERHSCISILKKDGIHVNDCRSLQFPPLWFFRKFGLRNPNFICAHPTHCRIKVSSLLCLLR